MTIAPHPFDNPEFDAALAGTENAVALFRKTLKDAHRRLQEAFQQGTPAAELVLRRAEIIDSLLKKIWQRIMPQDGEAVALVAVGGYGRGELHPGSDIDLQILLRAADRESLRAPLERFLTFLWDIGLEVGHSVRTPAECAEEAAKDITVVTNLMESRWLIGSRALFDAMREATGPDHICRARVFSRRNYWSRSVVTTNTTTPPITWSPTSKRVRADCAIFKSSPGWRNAISERKPCATW